MEPDGTIPHSHELAVGTYNQLEKSSPHAHTHSTTFDPPQYYHYARLRQDPRNGLFLQAYMKFI
jgi:hypothetical protein